jgi:hypothetical protein
MARASTSSAPRSPGPEPARPRLRTNGRAPACVRGPVRRFGGGGGSGGYRILERTRSHTGSTGSTVLIFWFIADFVAAHIGPSPARHRTRTVIPREAPRDLRRCRISSADRGIRSPTLVLRPGSRTRPFRPYRRARRSRSNGAGGFRPAATHQSGRVDSSVGAHASSTRRHRAAPPQTVSELMKSTESPKLGGVLKPLPIRRSWRRSDFCACWIFTITTLLSSDTGSPSE